MHLQVTTKLSNNHLCRPVYKDGEFFSLNYVRERQTEKFEFLRMTNRVTALWMFVAQII